MERKEILAWIDENIKNKNLKKHMLAVEACMRHLARKFGEDENKWGIAGLVHDIDYEKTKDTPEKHGLVSAEMLSEKGFNEEIINAVKAHAGKKRPQAKIEIALYAVDPLTGLIVASALMHPEKKLKALDTGFVLRRFKEKRFAAGANREQIKKCEELGLSLEEFIEVCLSAMKEISQDLEL